MKSNEAGEWTTIEHRKKSVSAKTSKGLSESAQPLKILKKAAGDGKQKNENKGGTQAPASMYSKIFGEKSKRVIEKSSGKISENTLATKNVAPKTSELSKDGAKPLQITKKDEKVTSKPKKKIALFDVLLASATTVNQKPQPSTSNIIAKPVVKLHSNALRNLETVFEPKKFVQIEGDEQKKRKRKKQISTFKKRILRERMRMHIRKQIEIKYEEQKRKMLEEDRVKQVAATLEKEQSVVDAPLSTSIRIYNFANDVNWQDESEKDEIIADIKAVLTMIYENHQHTLSSFSPLEPTNFPDTAPSSSQSNTVFHHITSLSIWKWKNTVMNFHQDQAAEGRFSLSFIDIKFKHTEISQLYLQILNDMVIGGDSLRVFYSQIDHGEYVRQQIELKYPQLMLNAVSEGFSPTKEPVSYISENITENRELESEVAYTIILENVIQDEDEIQESDDVDEILRDVYSLCEGITLPNHTNLEDLRVTPRLLWVEKNTNHQKSQNLEFYQPDSQSPLELAVEMKLTSWKDAYQVYESLAYNGLYRVDWLALNRSYGKTEVNDSMYIRPISALCKVDDDRDLKFGIGFINFLSREEYDDEDERQEIMENLHALFSSTPVLSDLTATMTVEKVIFKLSGSENSTSDEFEKEEEEEAVDSLTAYLIVSGITFYQILKVYQSFNEMIISGQALKVEVIAVPPSGLLTTAANSDETSLIIEHDEFRKFSSLLVDDQGSQVLMIRSLSEKIAYLGSHESEIKGKQRILDQIIHHSGITTTLPSLERLSFVLINSHEPDISESAEETNVSYQVCLQFGHWREAVEAMIYFDRLLLGGCRITATMTTSYSNHDQNSGRTVIHEYKNHFPEKSEGKVEEIEVTSSSAGFYFDIQSWQSYFDCVYFEYFFLPAVEFPQLTVDQVNASSIVVENNDAADDIAVEQLEGTGKKKKKMKNSKVKEEKVVDMSGIEEADLISPKPGKAIYTVAKQVPKAGIRDSPLDPTIRVANEEVNLIVKEFLTAISNFQTRLKEENPTKWKTKMRYVVGMKQVLQQLEKTIAFSHQQALKCKLILIAPNTELNEELDEKLQKIISLAKEAEVPLLYCLSKRLLGKALQMTIKQSIVAIIDPNGIYDLFKKIVHYATV